jgi:hypothetical protein
MSQNINQITISNKFQAFFSQFFIFLPQLIKAKDQYQTLFYNIDKNLSIFLYSHKSPPILLNIKYFTSPNLKHE